MIDALWTRHRTHIQEDAYVWLQAWAKRVEEPSMAVDLFLIPLLEAKQNLGGHDTFVGVSEVQILIQSECRGVFEQMCANGVVVQHALHMVARLIHAKERQHI